VCIYCLLVVKVAVVDSGNFTHMSAVCNLMWALEMMSLCLCGCVWNRDGWLPPAVLLCAEWQHQSGCTIADLSSESDCINAKKGMVLSCRTLVLISWGRSHSHAYCPLSLSLPLINSSLWWFLTIDKSLYPAAFVQLSIKRKSIALHTQYKWKKYD